MGETFSPDVDETPHKNETPSTLVKRLSELKAAAAVDHFDQDASASAANMPA